jgi:hypothetical protein
LFSFRLLLFLPLRSCYVRKIPRETSNRDGFAPDTPNGRQYRDTSLEAHWLTQADARGTCPLGTSAETTGFAQAIVAPVPISLGANATKICEDRWSGSGNGGLGLWFLGLVVAGRRTRIGAVPERANARDDSTGSTAGSSDGAGAAAATYVAAIVVAGRTGLAIDGEWWWWYNGGGGDVRVGGGGGSGRP